MSQEEEKEELKIGRKLSDSLVDDDTAQKIKKNGIIIGIVVLIALLGLGYYYYSSSQAEKASQEAIMALSKVLPEYDKGNYKVALDGGSNGVESNLSGLVEIANKYSDVQEGKLAALYAGNAYLNTNQYDAAKKYFEMASSSDAEIVQSGAYAGLAVCFEETGKYEEAAENYKKAADKLNEDLLKSKYLYFSAINYEEAGKKDLAENIYLSIVELNRNSDFGHKSIVRLTTLGTKFD